MADKSKLKLEFIEPEEGTDERNQAADIGADERNKPSGFRKLKPEERIEPEFRKLSESEKIKPRGSQILAGVDDVLDIVLDPIRENIGTLVWNPSTLSFEALGPEEAIQAKEEGRLGIPGAAKRPAKGVIEEGLRFGGQNLVPAGVVGRAATFKKAPDEITPDANKLQRIKRFVGQQIHEAGETFKRGPAQFTTKEAGFGFSAGATGSFAAQVFNDSDSARFVGEILGGIAPSFTPTGIFVRASDAIWNKIGNMLRPFTPAGGLERGRGRTDRAIRAAGPEGRKKLKEGLETPTTLDPETGEPVLSDAQRSGIRELMALERSIMDHDEQLRHLGDEQMARANEIIQKSLDSIGTAPTTSVVSNLEDMHRYLDYLLETRIRAAALKTEDRIAALGPSIKREQTNIIVAEELRKALKAARDKEDVLYKLVDPDTKTPFKKSLAKLNEIKRDTGEGQKGDIASVAEVLNKLRPKAKPKSKITGDVEAISQGVAPVTEPLTTIKELRAVQVKLREVQGKATEAGDFNKARIAREIANEITEDLADIKVDKEQAENLQIAITFSRNLKERFNQGTVGRILSREDTGEFSIPEGLTLEASIGVGNDPKAREAMVDLMKAFNSPETPNVRVVIEAAEDYIKARFLEKAVFEGQLNLRSAKSFVRTHSELLKVLPDLRSQIDEAIESGKSLVLVEGHRARVKKLQKSNVSKATMFIMKSPSHTFREIGKLKPAAAGREMQLLINRVVKDKTGEATEGLKSAFVEFLMEGAEEGIKKPRDISGRRFVSGVVIREQLDNPSIKEMAKRLLTKEEQDRLETITRDLMLLEQARTISPSIEGILSDKPSKTARILAKILGAASGSKINKALNAQTIQIPAFMSERFQAMLEAGISDPASRLLIDAAFDRELYSELLIPPLNRATGELSETAIRRLNIWAYNAIAEYGGIYDEEEEFEREFVRKQELTSGQGN